MRAFNLIRIKMILLITQLAMLSGCDSQITNWINSSLRNPAFSPDSEIKNPNLSDFSIVQAPSIARMTGESIQFSVTGAEGSFSWIDGGSGFLNLSTGQYTIPLSATEQVETVQARDGLGRLASAQVRVQKMKTVHDMSSSINTTVATIVKKISASPNGTLWANLGTSTDWNVLKSTDNGATFTMSEGYRYSVGEETRPFHVKAKDNNTIFAVGKGEVSGFDGPGVVRRSLDAGATWSTVDLLGGSGGDGEATAIEVDSSGNIFINAAINGVWVIRKSVDNGTTWTTAFNSGVAGHGSGISIDPVTGYIYAAGTLGNLPYSVRIVRSVDGGANWTTIDNYAGGTNAAVVYDIAARNNVVVAVGGDRQGLTSGLGGGCDGVSWTARRWWTRVSVDAGSNWNLREYFQTNASRGAKADSVVILPTGEILVGGTADNANACSLPLVRKSTDNGVTWSDAYAGPSETPREIVTGVLSNVGTKIFFGITRNSGAVHSMLQSTDSGATWSNFSLPMPVPNTSQVYGLAKLPNGKLLASSNGKSYISSDLGTTWTQVDTYASTDFFGALALSNTNLFVSGQTSTGHLLIRKSSDGGANWATSDDYQCPGPQTTFNTSLNSDNIGNIYALGYCYNAGGGTNGYVRKSTDSGNSWTTSDFFQYTATKNTVFSKLVADHNNNLYVLATVVDGSNRNHILVRKSTDQGATWTTPLDESEAGSDDGASGYTISFVSNSFINNGLLIAYKYRLAGISRWKVKLSLDFGTSWNTIVDKSETGGIGNLILVADSDSLKVIAVDAGDTTGAELASPSWGSKIWLTRNLTDWVQVDTVDTKFLAKSAISCGSGDSKICIVGVQRTEFSYVVYWLTRVLSD